MKEMTWKQAKVLTVGFIVSVASGCTYGLLTAFREAVSRPGDTAWALWAVFALLACALWGTAIVVTRIAIRTKEEQ